MPASNRYSIVFSDKFERVLREIVKEERISKAEAIRRSVAVYAYLIKELSIGHNKLQIVDVDNNTIKEIVLYGSITGEPRKAGSGRKARSEEPSAPINALSEQPA